jgi:hypothetical protein
MKIKFLIFMLFLLALNSCYKQKYEPLTGNTDSDFNFTIADTANVRDDGTTIVPLYLKKNTVLKTGLTVTFAANMGSIVASNTNLDNSQIDTIFLKVSQDTGKYVITATINNGTTPAVQKVLNFRLNPAYADAIAVETDSATLHTTTAITLMTQLTRKYGLVSVGVPVTFSAYQFTAAGDSIKVGRFVGQIGNSTDSTGKIAAVKFYSDTKDIDTTKSVSIELFTPGNNHLPLIKKLTFKY